jgi:hypothetical protein
MARKPIKRRKQIRIDLVFPHIGGQRAIYLHPARFQVVACGRRFGKTELGKVLAAREMVKNAGEVWWIAPQYKMSTAVWRMMLKTFRPIASWISAQERTIELANGGKLVVWAGDSNPDAMRGGAPHLVILDEAAMLPNNELWFGIIMPALMDHIGRAYFLSTPRGRNWFYEIFQMGLDDDPKYADYKSWNFPSNYNPYLPPQEFEKAKLSPGGFFEQEYLARFMEDSGTVFKGVADASLGLFHQPYSDGIFVIGVDWGRKLDYTVFSIIDIVSRYQVEMVRINKIDWKDQRDALKELIDTWKPIGVYVEDNSIGDVLLSNLLEEGIKVIPHYTTNQSKREIVEQLAFDIENKNVTLLNDPTQVRELQAFQMERTPSGKITYNAPSGYHDDTVIALAIANYYSVNHFQSFGGGLPIIKGWETYA